jgi:hypothetical protein
MVICNEHSSESLSKTQVHSNMQYYPYIMYPEKNARNIIFILRSKKAIHQNQQPVQQTQEKDKLQMKVLVHQLL